MTIAPNSSIGWGIIAPGNIAGTFAKALNSLPDAHLQAVAGRNLERSAAFAATHGARTTHNTIDDLLADPQVQVVYIAAPHSAHHALAKAALSAGKAVLVEKPITINQAQAADLVGTARSHRAFLMEAMWTRFLPIMEQVRQWIRSGAIGEVRLVRASFGFRFGWHPEHRLLNPALAGGALLDVGVYPISLALDAFALHPHNITASAHIGISGVDEQTAMILSFPGGGLAVLDCAVQTNTQHVAEIYGTEGRIAIPAMFWCGTQAQLFAGDGSLREDFNQPHPCNGYEFEIMAVNQALRQGLVEEPRCSHAASLAITGICDQIREQIHLRYPDEE